MIVVVSDGAGSAKHAEVGSDVVCRIIWDAASRALQSDPTGGSLTKELVEAWVTAAQTELAAEAQKLAATPRDLACTMLGAVVTKSRAVFFQIGDGAIIRWDGNTYRLVFPPDRGEYANNTYFVTEERASERLQFQLFEGVVDELAVLSDGLQMLAINYADQEAHAPFFSSMFAALRKAVVSEDVAYLQVPFLQFLRSKRVNERTDDDKTLVIATRLVEQVVPPAADEPNSNPMI